MDVEDVRAFCLSLPGATEGVQWGDDLLFRVGGKIFAGVSLERAPHRLSFKCTPEQFAELVEREGIIPAPYMARNHWVMLEHLGALDAAELRQHLKASYDMVRAKLTKKVQAQLDGNG